MLKNKFFTDIYFFKTQQSNICTMNPTKFVMNYCEETFMYRLKQMEREKERETI